MEKLQLVFVPLPGIGHLISMVEAAKLLLNRHNHLSITVLILKLSHSDSKFNNFIDSIAASTTTTLSNRIRFIDLPNAEPEISNFATSVERQKPHVKEIVSKMTQSESTSDSPRLAGFVLDMFCTPIIDVANEFGVPSYIFFTSSAAFLGFVLHLLEIHDEKRVDPTEEFKDSDAELALPSFVNPFPARVLPYGVLSKERLPILLNHIRRFRETKGIIVNTFVELESYAMQSFSDGILPPVYPVGPILNVGSDGSNNKQQEIIQWLNDQPTSSVVFLCFGSMGSFSVEQVKEIACALEHSGHRFLWSLRRPPSTGRFEFPSDDEDPQEVLLPEGFLDRTVEIGKIIGWAPQAAILAHPAVGGFVSHCGWNSILESIWYGVPIATWPLYAEQQFNAFEMVIELQLGVEIKMDYRMESRTIINSDEIERGIWCVMEHNNEQRKKLKEMSESSRKTLINGGSSYIWLDHLIKDVIDNIV